MICPAFPSKLYLGLQVYITTLSLLLHSWLSETDFSWWLSDFHHTILHRIYTLYYTLTGYKTKSSSIECWSTHPLYNTSVRFCIACWLRHCSFECSSRYHRPSSSSWLSFIYISVPHSWEVGPVTVILTTSHYPMSFYGMWNNSWSNNILLKKKTCW